MPHFCDACLQEQELASLHATAAALELCLHPPAASLELSLRPPSSALALCPHPSAPLSRPATLKAGVPTAVPVLVGKENDAPAQPLAGGRIEVQKPDHPSR